MEPGFLNFQRVKKGQLIAKEHGKRVLSPYSGRILLPLYQGTGDDGFFIATETKLSWMRVASCIRMFKLDTIAHWLPGIKRNKKDKSVLLVNRRMASMLGVEIFYLLGFHKEKTEDRYIVFQKKNYHLKLF